MEDPSCKYVHTTVCKLYYKLKDLTFVRDVMYPVNYLQISLIFNFCLPHVNFYIWILIFIVWENKKQYSVTLSPLFEIM